MIFEQSIKACFSQCRRTLSAWKVWAAPIYAFFFISPFPPSFFGVGGIGSLIFSCHPLCCRLLCCLCFFPFPPFSHIFHYVSFSCSYFIPCCVPSIFIPFDKRSFQAPHHHVCHNEKNLWKMQVSLGFNTSLIQNAILGGEYWTKYKTIPCFPLYLFISNVTNMNIFAINM